ncbi:MAG: hypothetical protein HY690_09860 [Chloroflexi bacterium]|nr:hypothetical protein [Chloroflexota bacterium]
MRRKDKDLWLPRPAILLEERGLGSLGLHARGGAERAALEVLGPLALLGGTCGHGATLLLLLASAGGLSVAVVCSHLLDTYSHLLPNLQDEAAARMQAILASWQAPKAVWYDEIRDSRARGFSPRAGVRARRRPT